MQRHKIVWLALACPFFLPPNIDGQEDRAPEPVVVGTATVPSIIQEGRVPKPVIVRTETVPLGGRIAVNGLRRQNSASSQALQKLRKAKTEEDKEDARDELEDALNEEYDKYVEQQEKELRKMEKQLEELRDQLDRRRDAKQELVRLRLKTMEKEAEGLGWPNGSTGTIPGPGVRATQPLGTNVWRVPKTVEGNRVIHYQNITPNDELGRARRVMAPIESLRPAGGPVPLRARNLERPKSDEVEVTEDELEEEVAENEETEEENEETEEEFDRSRRRGRRNRDK